MRARFKGTCALCGKPIDVDQEISWAPGMKAKHMGCAVREGAEIAAGLPNVIVFERYRTNKRATSNRRRFETGADRFRRKMSEAS